MAAPSDATRRPRGAGSFTQQRQSRGPAIRQPPARHLTEDTQQPSITKPAQQPGRLTSINKRRLRPRARAPAFAGAFGDLQACHGSDAGHTLERFAPSLLTFGFRRRSPRCVAIGISLRAYPMAARFFLRYSQVCWLRRSRAVSQGLKGPPVGSASDCCCARSCGKANPTALAGPECAFF